VEDSFLHLVRKRRSVRSYRADPVEKEKIEYILEAARLAPSACNRQPWRFIVVDDESMRGKICRDGLGGIVSNEWARTAPVIIVLSVTYSPLVHTAGKVAKGIDYRLLDAGIAGEHICLAAAEQGLGTCWIGWFNARAIKRIVGMPVGWKVVALITLGYEKGEGNDAHEKKRLRPEDICFFNRF